MTGILRGRAARNRDPLARELGRVAERQDAICDLLAGIYRTEGLPVPPVLAARQPSWLAPVLRLVAR